MFIIVLCKSLIPTQAGGLFSFWGLPIGFSHATLTTAVLEPHPVLKESYSYPLHEYVSHLGSIQGYAEAA